MTEPARVLHLVNGDGEAERVCPDCIAKDAEKTRMYKSMKAENDALRRQLEEKHPPTEDVQMVFDHWARRVVQEGWWSQPPKLNAPRREAISARVKEYDVQYCLQVVEGALFQSREGIKREWVDASSIFKAGNIERHYERAQDPYCQKVTAARKLPEAVWRLVEDPALPYLCEECSCGHLRLDHSKPDPARDNADPCLVHGCVCDEFDETWVWEQRILEQLRRCPAKCDLCGRPVTVEQWVAHEASSVGGVFTHLACSLRWAERPRSAA